MLPSVCSRKLLIFSANQKITGIVEENIKSYFLGEKSTGSFSGCSGVGSSLMRDMMLAFNSFIVNAILGLESSDFFSENLNKLGFEVSFLWTFLQKLI